MKMDKKITLRIEMDLFEMLNDLAIYENETISECIRTELKTRLNYLERKNQKLINEIEEYRYRKRKIIK